MPCVQNVSVIDKRCLNKCQGVFITGIVEKELDLDQVKKILSKVDKDYEGYKLGGDPKVPSFVGGK